MWCAIAVVSGLQLPWQFLGFPTFAEMGRGSDGHGESEFSSEAFEGW